MAARSPSGRPGGRPKVADARRSRREPTAPPTPPPPGGGARASRTLRDAVDELAGAAWLQPADAAAVALARAIAGVIEPPPPAPTPGLLVDLPAPATPPVDAKALRELGPMLVGLISDLGGTPQARNRLDIAPEEMADPFAAFAPPET